MTNHIEEMMKAAGVKQKFRYIVLFFNNEYEARREDMPIYFKALKKGDIKVKRVIKYYPPFTPAKQLELIKLLFKKIPTSLNFYFEPIENTDKWQYIHTDLTFEEALAEMVWNALTVLDKAEVKRVLEDE